MLSMNTPIFCSQMPKVSRGIKYHSSFTCSAVPHRLAHKKSLLSLVPPQLRASVDWEQQQQQQRGRLRRKRSLLSDPAAARRFAGLCRAQAGNGSDEMSDGEEDGGEDDVNFEVDKLGNNTRRIHAAIQVQAPARTVYGLLTSYETLADFIPGLLENTVEKEYDETEIASVKLRQVAEQNLALGAKLAVTAVLNITERPLGVTEGDILDRDILAVEPCTGLPGPAQDICFTLVESRDLKEFTGTWRIQQPDGDEPLTRLSYVTQVRPQPWLPIKLISNRVRNEISDNLRAVRDEAERVYTSSKSSIKLAEDSNMFSARIS